MDTCFFADSQVKLDYSIAPIFILAIDQANTIIRSLTDLRLCRFPG